MIEVEICFVEYYKNVSSFYIIEKIINDQFQLYSLSSPTAKIDGRIKFLDALYIKR